MSGRQLRAFIERAGISQQGAAEAIGVSSASMFRYLTDDYPVPRTVEFALRWVVHQYEIGKIKVITTAHGWRPVSEKKPKAK
jgi:hypothetical protein